MNLLFYMLLSVSTWIVFCFSLIFIPAKINSITKNIFKHYRCVTFILTTSFLLTILFGLFCIRKVMSESLSSDYNLMEMIQTWDMFIAILISLLVWRFAK